jgi:hypothetical protein
MIRLVEFDQRFCAKVLRLLEPSAYALLYRRDRTWLMTLTSQLPSPPPCDSKIQLKDPTIARLLDTLNVMRTSSAPVFSVDLLDSVPELRDAAVWLLQLPKTSDSMSKLRQRLTSYQFELF